MAASWGYYSYALLHPRLRVVTLIHNGSDWQLRAGTELPQDVRLVAAWVTTFAVILSFVPLEASRRGRRPMGWLAPTRSVVVTAAAVDPEGLRRLRVALMMLSDHAAE
ncbi:MAG: hypothetical protein ACFCBW_13240 [Candidatus Competibacterales bacterium]